VADLESFAVVRNDKEIQSADFNFWGVTFTRDPNRIYATLGTGGRILLVEGDVAATHLPVIAEDIECPSLSPDETHIAFKKRFGSGFDAWWQPAVVDLATMTVRQLPESKHIDDQIEWLDDGHILYAGRAFDERDCAAARTSGRSPSTVASFLVHLPGWTPSPPAVVRR
jgi:Tol biopolymer transport system component